MKPILIGAAAVALAVPAVAQVTPPPAAPRAAKVHTRAEMQAKVARHFAKLDANRDGFITQAEAQNVRQQVRTRVSQRAGERIAQRGAKAFDRLDANRDGQLSRQEFDAGRQVRAQRIAGRGDRAHRGGRMGMRTGGFHGRMFEMADANRDGRVTLAEAQTAALRHFDMMDVNRDGQITPDERRQMRQHLRGQHHQG
jgi:hypothetical protein